MREGDAKGKLETLNPHERDARITFEEEGHKYFIDGVRYNGPTFGGVSSTTFIHQFFKEFDKEGCVKAILRNPKHRSDATYRYYGMTRDQILDQWAALGSEACDLGTKFHAAVEYHQNDLPVDDEQRNSVEFRQYLEFRRDHPNWIPYRTEQMIFDEEHRITGAIDALMLDTIDNSLVIVDWKRSKAIKRKAFRSNDVGLFPIESLQNCNFHHYSLQLSLYKSILNRLYGLKVKLCTLVVCYPTQTTYDRIDVQDVDYEIQLLLDYRKHQLQKIGKVPKDPTVSEAEWRSIRE